MIRSPLSWFNRSSSPTFGIVVWAFVNGGAPEVALGSPQELYLQISASESEPYPSTSTPWVGERTLYLWSQGIILEAAGSEFAFEGSLEVIDLAPRPGVTNSGTATSPILAYSECVYSQVVAELRVLDATGVGGTLCFTGSTESGKNCSLICESNALWQSHYFFGFSSDGSPPCEGVDVHPECMNPLAIDQHTWGRIKASYRE